MTDEPATLVDGWVAKNKPRYPIAILPDGELEDAIGVKFFPYGAVIGPDGTVAYQGSLGNIADPLEEALAKAEGGSLFPKALAKAIKLMREDKLDKSYGEILKLIEGGKVDEADMPAVDGFKAYLEGQATSALEDARKSHEEGMVYAAATRLEPFVEAKPPFPATADCRTLLEALEALPDFKKEMKGGEAYVEAQRLRGASEFTDAVEELKKIYKKYDGTRIAERARADAEELVRERRTGYASHCMDCRGAGRACDKHYEEVKL